MSNYITVEGLCFDLDKLSDAGRKELHEATGERPEQGVVTQATLLSKAGYTRASIRNSNLEDELIFAHVVNSSHTPTEALQLARALTVAALEKLRVVAPKSHRAAAFGGFVNDGGSALALLDDLLRGARQEECA